MQLRYNGNEGRKKEIVAQSVVSSNVTIKLWWKIINEFEEWHDILKWSSDNITDNGETHRMR